MSYFEGALPGQIQDNLNIKINNEVMDCNPLNELAICGFNINMDINKLEEEKILPY